MRSTDILSLCVGKLFL